MTTFKELNWQHIDVQAIVAWGGLATIEEQRYSACRTWLSQNGYSLDTLDCSRPLSEVVTDLRRILKWEEQFGYTPDPHRRSLDALRDGFRFEIPEGGGHVLELVRVDIAWEQDSDWIRGLLRITQEYSRWQLALGRRFFALLVVAEQSSIIGATIEETQVPRPFWAPIQAVYGFES